MTGNGANQSSAAVPLVAAGRAPGPARRGLAFSRDPHRQPLIRFESVTRRFGQVIAVDDVSLSVHAGEMFCLLGPSGCGKTTLMRMLAGFERPDQGRIWLDGQDITDVPPHARPVNMMFQSYALFPHLSVADNIAFGLRQQRMGRADIDKRVERMLELVQLRGFEARKPGQLSGGQKQRVALARALARQPKVLLLDEPLGALDRKTREQTQFELIDIQIELGATFVVVTHDQDEAMVMADRIGVMEKGRLAQIGSPAEIYEQPASRSVASFVGDVNLFDVTVIDSASGLTLFHGPGGARFQAETPAEPLSPGQSVAIALRPEKVAIEPDAGQLTASDSLNSLQGEIWDIGYLGDWTVYRVRLASGQLVRVSKANAQRHVAAPLNWEDKVVLSFTPDAVMVLAR